MTVTKAELDALRAQLATPVRQMQLTPGGTIEQAVHQGLFEQQQDQLQAGEQSLDQAQHTMRQELLKMRTRKQKHVEFNAQSQTIEM